MFDSVRNAEDFDVSRQVLRVLTVNWASHDQAAAHAAHSGMSLTSILQKVTGHDERHVRRCLIDLMRKGILRRPRQRSGVRSTPADSFTVEFSNLHQELLQAAIISASPTRGVTQEPPAAVHLAEHFAPPPDTLSPEVHRRMLALADAAHSRHARLLVLLTMHDGLRIDQAANVLNMTSGKARDILETTKVRADEHEQLARRAKLREQSVAEEGKPDLRGHRSGKVYP